MPPPAGAELGLGTPVSLPGVAGVPGWGARGGVRGDARPPPPRSYFGYSQSPAKAQEALKEDEREVEVEEDGGKESVFELTHEALGEREDEQELWKGQKNRQTDRQRETVSRSRSWGPGAASGREHSSQGPWRGHAGTPAPREGAGGTVAGLGGGHPSVCPGDAGGGLRPAPPPPGTAPYLLQPLHVFEVETDVEKTQV